MVTLSSLGPETYSLTWTPLMVQEPLRSRVGETGRAPVKSLAARCIQAVDCSGGCNRYSLNSVTEAVEGESSLPLEHYLHLNLEQVSQVVGEPPFASVEARGP